MFQCESQKYDMEFECRKKDFEVWVELLFSTLGWIQVKQRPFISLVHSHQPLCPLNPCLVNRLQFCCYNDELKKDL